MGVVGNGCSMIAPRDFIEAPGALFRFSVSGDAVSGELQSPEVLLALREEARASASVRFVVLLPAGDINWKTTNDNPEFVYTLNRQDWWVDLAQSYVLTGDAKYVNEMI